MGIILFKFIWVCTPCFLSNLLVTRCNVFIYVQTINNTNNCWYQGEVGIIALVCWKLERSFRLVTLLAWIVPVRPDIPAFMTSTLIFSSSVLMHASIDDCDLCVILVGTFCAFHGSWVLLLSVHLVFILTRQPMLMSPIGIVEFLPAETCSSALEINYF